MSFIRFETNRYCVGGRHRSATGKNYGDITSDGSEVLIGCCSICNRKKSMAVRDNTITAEVLSFFVKHLGRKGLNVSKKMAKNVSKKPSRVLDITSILATAAETRNPKNAMKSLPEPITFYNTGKGLYIGKFV